MDACSGRHSGGKQEEEMNRYNIDTGMKDCRKWKTSHNGSDGSGVSVAAFRLAFLRSLSPFSLPLPRARTHKSQAGLSLHDRAKLLWLNTQEYEMIKVSGAFWGGMETWFIALYTTADWNVKRLGEYLVRCPLTPRVFRRERAVAPLRCGEALTVGISDGGNTAQVTLCSLLIFFFLDLCKCSPQSRTVVRQRRKT